MFCKSCCGLGHVIAGLFLPYPARPECFEVAHDREIMRKRI
jgi:hypothetical protein